ncbi:CRISPR-associated protein Csm5 [Candidatus Kryptonium thompsonii]|uniref:CRISPR system Cms protein Csm5 n=1 Tax=Candidatus Kryptonium thompsonii TaxID=1633631 RepID=A0ABM9UU49_9BACT|nr:type III-A CRISPR-associated RAMP protein Csm5 [Candidatus Kryptonium thompsoni]CUS83273.1 CRISPR-associated protein Csm5 [Candidatus Kryptonium thompsoni]
MAEIYKVKYQILTPIHIGTGEDLTPFDYVIVDDNFHRVNADEIISSLSQEQLNKFYALIEQNNITSLRELIAGNFDEKRFSKYKVKVTKNVAEKYQWNLRNVNNQLLISPFVRVDGDFKPYIPGSSIKGAIRTAIIDRVAKDNPEMIKRITSNEKEYKSNTWEHKLLKAVRVDQKKKEEKVDISKDPFRALKISDVFVSNEVMRIGEVLNARVDERRNRLATVGIQMIKEVIAGEIITGGSVEFEGEMIIDDFLPKVEGVSMPLTKDFIIQSCNQFYSEEFKREQEFYEFATDMNETIDKMKSLLRVKQNECLVRVGRFSGVYAVTINARKPHNRKWGTTRNLFEGRYPMGWMKIKFVG